MWESLRKSYSGVGNVLARYWIAYGGIRALLVSPYLHASLILTLIMAPYWLHQGWWEIPLSVLPNVLGFTLAGFTIWLGFGDEAFRQRMAAPPKNNGGTSAFLGISAGFAHFVIVQIMALIAAVLAKAMDFPLPNEHWLVPIMRWLAPLGWGIGFLLFLYAILAALAATLGVFRAASWYGQPPKTGD
jgi:hypothetical protein